MINVVFDTNVLVAGLRSREGASGRLVQLLNAGCYRPIITTTLCLEYEDVLFRPGLLSDYSLDELNSFLNRFVAVASKRQVHYRWRPHLPDAGDDFVLEAALAGRAPYVVAHNRRHFLKASSLNVRAVTPAEFLAILFGP